VAERFGLSIYAVSVGEIFDDTHLFETRALAHSMMGPVD